VLEVEGGGRVWIVRGGGVKGGRGVLAGWCGFGGRGGVKGEGKEPDIGQKRSMPQEEP